MVMTMTTTSLLLLPLVVALQDIAEGDLLFFGLEEENKAMLKR
jgi:hypothetical protein